jgi:phosphoglycerate kinase
MKKLSVRRLDVAGRRVFLRVDLNVPFREDGTIRSDSRIRAALPTIRYLLGAGATVICASHLGKAKGKPDPALSLRPVAVRLAELLGRPVTFVPDCVGSVAKQAADAAAAGSTLLLENLRFHPGETADDPGFARELASLADCYVNDAFGSAHRAHASTAGIARFFDRPAAGLLVEAEIDYLSRLVESPAQPYVAVIGGSKVSDKAGVIANLLPKVSNLLVGGGVAFNFLKARGLEIGRSLWESDLAVAVAGLAGNPKLVPPTDVVVAAGVAGGADARTVTADAIPADMMGLDIGPASARRFADLIAAARTVVWAGPMGVFEQDAFAHGSEAVARAMAAATTAGATTVVGGGDTGAALAKFGLADNVSHVSTGGGACLELLEGKTLPGVAALADQ